MNNGITSQLTREKCNELYDKIIRSRNEPMMKILALGDLFFLLTRICRRRDIDNQWLFERCREVEANPNGYLDLWAREHYKSTLITFGLTLQDILNDPDLVVGIFSIIRPVSKKFLGQIKVELEDNVLLKRLVPEVLWENPQREAPIWSLDDGLILKRKSNPKEATVSAWGLVGGMPTGLHFNIRVYDDIIDEDNVSTPEMIQKATDKWELSLNLGSTALTQRYDEVNIERYIGTRYHLNDPYKEIMRRGIVIPRIYPGTIDGKVEGEPVLWSREIMSKKRRGMGPYTFACQILLDPVADEVQNFKPNWIKRYESLDSKGMNLYLLCDPAGEKKKSNDYTVMLVIGLAEDGNYYLVDGIRDRLNLTERARHFMGFHRKYRPRACGYEKIGKDSDIEAFQWQMEHEGYRFEIEPLGAKIPKNDRIRKLIPVFEQGRFYLPWRLLKKDYQGKDYDLARDFVNDEYLDFPFGSHDDLLDCAAKILDEDLGAVFPASASGMNDQKAQELYERYAPPPQIERRMYD